MFISLSELGGTGDDEAIAELSVRALCSNRHLTEHLPIGVGGADFRLVDDFTLDLVCVAGPTPPREPVIRQLRSRSETAHTGTVTWRLVNLLSTNHLGLVDRGAGHNAQAIRETLSLFAEMADSATERRIRGIRHVDSRPIVRRIRQRSGVGVARGIEITVTIDEKAFEGTGAFLLGAVLDRFLCRVLRLQSFHPDRDPLRRPRRDHAMAAPHGNAQAAMSELRTSQPACCATWEAEPWRFDYFTVLRHLERVHENRPRIGDSASLRDELVPARAGSVHGFSGLEPRPRRAIRGQAAQGFRQIPGNARTARGAAARDDRGGLSLRPRQ